MAKTNKTQPDDEEIEAEAEGGAEGEEAGQASAKGWIPFKLPFAMSRKLMMIVGGAVVLLSAVGGGAYYFLGHHSENAAVATKVKPPLFVDMPEVLVNLSGSGGNNERTQYLKVKIALEVPDQAVMADIQPVMPRLLDTFQTYLRELRPTDLDGSAGLYRLKEELTRRVDAAIAPNRINAVLFKEIVIQ